MISEDTDPGLYRALNQLRKRAVRRADMNNPAILADQETSDFFNTMINGIDSIESDEDIRKLIMSLKDKNFNNDTAREINNLIRMFGDRIGEVEKEYVRIDDDDDDDDDPDEEDVSYLFRTDNSPTGIHNPADFKHYFFEGE